MSEDAYQIEPFLEMMAAERGASRNTIAAYRRDLEGLLEILKKRGKSATKAERDDIEAFLSQIKKEGMSARTGARK
jgi:integrase/recombinase XerD